MTDRDVTFLAGATARWGRQLRKSDRLMTVCYEADVMAKLTLDGGAPAYMRGIFAGMDDVDEHGEVPVGFGVVNFSDIKSGDELRGRVDWFLSEGQDKGTFHFEDGTGAWSGVRGSIPVELAFTTKEPNALLNVGSPVEVMGFLEGSGRLSFDA